MRREKRRGGKEPLLSAKDFRQYLLEHAAQIAPGDVETLVAARAAVAAKINGGCGDHALLQTQLRFALELLTDHAQGRSPQIPYHTVSLLAVAMLYFLNPFDVIPDDIPRVGLSDDALMAELAFELAAPGVERYATWKGVQASSVLVNQSDSKKKATPPRRAPRCTTRRRRG